MAKINIEYDSVKKTMSLFIDGQPIEDCQYLSFYRYGDDEGAMSMEMTLKPQKFDGLTSHIRVSAATDPKIQGKSEPFSQDGTLIKHPVLVEKKRWW